MPDGAGMCRHCNKSRAVWRCKDCHQPSLRCRACIRFVHLENPFHRIERWTGSYFRPAELREAGLYLLIRHHSGVSVCETLSRWCTLLDSAESVSDRDEQELLRGEMTIGPVPDIPRPEDEDEVMDMLQDEFGMEIEDDDEDDDIGDDEIDEDENETGRNADPGLNTDPALAAATILSPHRVVHTNGIHSIALVSCQCRGEEILPLDLVASQLFPASLKRIRTLFTAQVLDHFRLSNLELKASAYQYYQLLRRITKPMAPGEVLNLYREFRRMTRIWRWMKRLKWAGYAGSSKKVSEVQPGELAIFCPACPQAGINIPDNWREDNARHVFYFMV